MYVYLCEIWVLYMCMSVFIVTLYTPMYMCMYVVLKRVSRIYICIICINFNCFVGIMYVCFALYCSYIQ